YIFRDGAARMRDLLSSRVHPAVGRIQIRHALIGPGRNFFGSDKLEDGVAVLLRAAPIRGDQGREN
ncbi:MAG: hypothetical protein ABI963_12400, partial [Rhizomicrobium sp.]